MQQFLERISVPAFITRALIYCLIAAGSRPAVFAIVVIELRATGLLERARMKNPMIDSTKRKACAYPNRLLLRILMRRLDGATRNFAAIAHIAPH